MVLLCNLGGGVPDLLVGYRGTNFLFEIKDGQKPESQRRLTKDEQWFFETYRGIAWIVCSLEEAIEILMRETC